MIYCFDLDGTLCTNTGGQYAKAEPLVNRIARVNNLYNEGHKIIISTARGSETKLDWYALTQDQLVKWGVKYHELYVGKKPNADFYIDDRAINAEVYFQ